MPEDRPVSGTTTMDLSRYHRQMLFNGLGREGQELLARSSVGLIGCGALGSVVATQLTRAGVGHLRLIDRDFPDLSNLHRQILFDEQDIDSSKPKAIIAAERLRAGNSDVQVEPIVGDLNPHTVDAFADGMDVLVDATDNFSTRYLINDWSVKHRIPWVYGGVVGASGVTLTVVPGEGPCFRCLYPSPPQPDQMETCDTAGVLNMVVGVIASLEAVEVLKLLVDPTSANRRLLILDVWEGCFDYVEVARLEDCPACARNDFLHLRRDRSTVVERMCGSDTYQVVRPDAQDLRLENLADRLCRAGTVFNHGIYLVLETSEVRLVIFRDGRALVAGAADEANAKAIYDHFIGS